MDASMVARLKDLKDKIKHQNHLIDGLKVEQKDLEQEIIDALDGDQSSLSRTAFGTVSIVNEVIASPTDWKEFEQYCIDNNALYLFQRRVSNVAWREEVATRGPIPGVESFTKRKLSLTSKTS